MYIHIRTRMYFCVPTWMYFDSYLYTGQVNPRDPLSVMDIELFLVGSLEQQVFWVFLDVVFSLSWVYKFAKWEHKETTIQVAKQTFCVFTKLTDSRDVIPILLPYQQYHAFRGHFKTSSMHWASCWNVASLDGLPLFVSRLFQEWKSCSGWHKYWCAELAWLNDIIYKHRLKECCPICLESFWNQCKSGNTESTPIRLSCQNWDACARMCSRACSWPCCKCIPQLKSCNRFQCDWCACLLA